jgi:mono/diheme cytochrome c family protein
MLSQLRITLLAMAFTLLVTATRGADAPAKPVSFVRDVRPILARNCFACHGPDEMHREADLRLDTREGALAEHDGKRAVVPSDAAKSQLVQRILSSNDDERMPPKDSGKTLTPEQIDLLKRWIEQGAARGEECQLANERSRPLRACTT